MPSRPRPRPPQIQTELAPIAPPTTDFPPQLVRLAGEFLVEQSPFDGEGGLGQVGRLEEGAAERVWLGAVELVG